MLPTWRSRAGAILEYQRAGGPWNQEERGRKMIGFPRSMQKKRGGGLMLEGSKGRGGIKPYLKMGILWSRT